MGNWHGKKSLMSRECKKLFASRRGVCRSLGKRLAVQVLEQQRTVRDGHWSRLELLSWGWCMGKDDGVLATKGKKLNLPPSPPKLPIIGNIHQLGKLPHRSFRDFSKKYGSLLLLQLGYNPTLVVSSAQMAREIVKNHDIVFSNRPKTTAANMLLYGCTDVGFAPCGEYWRQVRKVSVLELFSHRRVHSFQYLVRDEEVEVLINKIRRASVKEECINLTDLLMAVSSNIVSRCVLIRKAKKMEAASLDICQEG
ncbi:hypothetical protein CRYUN_Cryun12cG0166600 [Craigia yunnanensis]